MAINSSLWRTIKKAPGDSAGSLRRNREAAG
jgi:hypothetical protein